MNTLSATSSLGSAPTTGLWNIIPCVYTLIGSSGTAGQKIILYDIVDADKAQKTAVDQVGDAGGRRLAVYEYPYQDGQLVEDLGRKGETYTFNFKFWGQNYKTKLDEFFSVVVKQNSKANITHPIRGSLVVRFKDYDIVHKYDETNAVTIKATFIEDTGKTLQSVNSQASSSDAAQKNALQNIVKSNASISSYISQASALLLVPASVKASLINQLNSITGQASRLLGQLAATFSTNSQLLSLSTSSANISTGVVGNNSGTVVPSVVGASTQLPPVFQTGFDSTTLASINSQIDAFVNANQITVQQAVFGANQARIAIAAAIATLNSTLGNYAYDSVVSYRGLAVSIQEAVESSIASTQQQVTIYTVPYPMSLRKVAQENGLTPDRQNDIESLNPYLPSVNYIAAGSTLAVPTS